MFSLFFPWRMFTGRMIWPVNIADLTAPNPAAGLPARAATTKHLHPLPAKLSEHSKTHESLEHQEANKQDGM